ncbi:MAG TPA: LysR substrate-binding domain-containing protein [Candidatus Sulfotelmatobacter sp.]|jgi:LysR family glycine cleavage system transcriptional activator|nr:LysR substrate-binding domain-containing protein [Candidatus Sulfotelmatobacter sp.]
MFQPPSLRGLKALVEVARCGSAAGAANRLGVGASAVSHSLSELEAQMGGPLFEDRRRTRLNEKGMRLVQRLEPAFQSIDMAVADFRTTQNSIRLSTLSSFAQLWLIPRLARLRQRLPSVDILISTDTRPIDLHAEPYDCVIRWTGPKADWRGLEHERLFHEQLIQVASPHLLRQTPPYPRLTAHSRPDDWRLFGGEDTSVAVTMLATRGQMIEAALAGLGVAIIDLHLVAGTLTAGHLVQVGERRLDRPEAYVFAARPAALENPALRKFRSWLLEEALAAQP